MKISDTSNIKCFENIFINFFSNNEYELNSDTQQGNEILNKLIDKNSKFKSIAQELLIE